MPECCSRQDDFNPSWELPVRLYKGVRLRAQRLGLPVIPHVFDNLDQVLDCLGQQVVSEQVHFESYGMHSRSTVLQQRLELTTTFFQCSRPASLYGSGEASDPPP